MNEREQKAWQDGEAHGRISILCELLDESDKPECLLALFRKAAKLAETETNPVKQAKLQGYSEGMRHACNILSYRGKALEAYSGIISKEPAIPLTQEDISLLG